MNNLFVTLSLVMKAMTFLLFARVSSFAIVIIFSARARTSCALVASCLDLSVLEEERNEAAQHSQSMCSVSSEFSCSRHDCHSYRLVMVIKLFIVLAEAVAELRKLPDDFFKRLAAQVSDLHHVFFGL